MPRKPPPTFLVHFRGRGIYPERISWRRLAETMEAVQKLAMIGRTDTSEEADGESVHLIGIVRGSTGLQCYVEDRERALLNLRHTGKVLESENPPEDASSHIDPIRALSRIARSLNCTIELRGEDGAHLAIISADSDKQLTSSLIITGETTLVGRVERVGGATELRCAMRLLGRKDLLYCDVASTDVARELGERLYDDVVVSGVAQWLKTDWSIVGMRIHSITPSRRSSLRETFQTLRQAGGDAWDHVEDPDARLRELRGQ